MKQLVAILLLLVTIQAKSQNRIFGNAFYNVNSNKFGWFGTAGTDSLGYFDSLKIKTFKPFRPGAYTTAAAPSAANFPGYIIFNTDSLRPQFSNGTTWNNIGALTPTVYTFQQSLTESSGTVNLVNDQTSPGNLFFYGTNSGGTKGFQSLGATAFVQNGNSFGAAAVLGTNDANVLDIETNGTTIGRFNTDGTFALGTTTDVAQRFYVNGTSRFDGLMTFGASAGFSASSGVAMASFGASNVTTAWSWGLNNVYSNNNANRNLFEIRGDQNNTAATTQAITQFLIDPTINNTSGTTTFRGIYYNPTVTSLTGTTHIALETTSGLIRLRGIPAQPTTAYTILTHSLTSDSTTYQVPSPISNTAALDFPSTAAGTSSDLTITVTGATDGEVVSIGVPNGSTLSNGCFTAWVSASNTVTVRFTNNSSGALDPASGTFKATVFKW